MKKNQKGFSSVEVAMLLLVVGLVALAGYYVFNNDNATNSDTNTIQNSNSNVEKTAPPVSELGTDILEPISAEDFGDFGQTADDELPAFPDEPMNVGPRVEMENYQGIVVAESGSYKVYVGKLTDKSTGEVELTDAFFLVVNQSGKDISLKVADPNTIVIKSTSIIKWSNLSESNQMVQAIKAYKQNMQ